MAENCHSVPNQPLTIAQSAEWLQASNDTIRRLIARGDLKAYRYGPRVIRIDLEDLRRLRRPVSSTAAYREARAEAGEGA